jgi:hypothetical protein
MQRSAETQISEDHIIAFAAMIGVLMIVLLAFFSSTNVEVVESIARGAGYNLGRTVIDHAFGGTRHRR